MSAKSNSVGNDAITGGLSENAEAGFDAIKEDICEEKEATRTLQFVVYPSLLAFIVLAGYGFYLVRSLTTDVNRLAQTIVDMNQTIRDNLGGISQNMSTMSGNMVSMVASADSIGSHVAKMDESVVLMSGDVRQMNISTQNMAASTYSMQQDMWSMNKNVSKPFRMMGKFMPFAGGSDSRSYVAPPVPATYYYPGSGFAGYWPQVPSYPQLTTTPVQSVGSQPSAAPAEQPVNQLVVN